MVSTIGPTVDINEAAGIMKVHPQTVLDTIKSGELSAAKVGRAYVMLTKDVLDLVEAKIIAQTAERLGTPQRHQRRAARSLPRRLA